MHDAQTAANLVINVGNRPVSQLQKNLPWSYALADCGATAMTRLRQH
jgi:hypothetical protein